MQLGVGQISPTNYHSQPVKPPALAVGSVSKIAIGIDQVGGSILYGTEDWTVSSYTHILAQKGIRSAIYSGVGHW